MSNLYFRATTDNVLDIHREIIVPFEDFEYMYGDLFGFTIQTDVDDALYYHGYDSEMVKTADTIELCVKLDGDLYVWNEYSY